MYTFDEFQADVLRIAASQGYSIGYLRGTDIPQVDFGNKKLHGKHFRALFPQVLADTININKLIEEIAPGRPCSHRPFREIVQRYMLIRKMNQVIFCKVNWLNGM